MISRALLGLIVPTVVFFGGARLMLAVAGVDEPPSAQHGTTLNKRFGYTRDDVGQLWQKLPPAALDVERLLLQVDLVFPLAYGSALALALLAMWAGRGRPFSATWLLLPVVVGVLADWTENLVQLEQLRRFTRDGPSAIDGSWIAVASAATIVKLVSLIAAASVLAVLALWLMARGRAPA